MSLSPVGGFSVSSTVKPKTDSPRWLNQLIESDGKGILRLLWRMLGVEADVLDAYQDCFCKLASYPHPGDLRSARAFAYRTATNIAIELIRVRKRRAEHLPRISASQQAKSQPNSNGLPTGEEPNDPALERMREAIGELPAHLRQVVVLRDLGQMSYADVARILSIDPATARVYRRHAVVKLAELIGESGAP